MNQAYVSNEPCGRIPGKVVEMGEELLTSLKGFSRTYVIHSNKNPYAAAAAMGMMAARSQEFGTYFRPSRNWIPLIEEGTRDEIGTQRSADQIAMDFIADWVMYLCDTGLPSCGLAYDDTRTPKQNTMRFLNAYNRRIPPPRPRVVRESHELTIPHEFRQDYDTLLSLVRTGNDLRPYLSRDILRKRRPDRSDPLLNCWGIQHLHFRDEGTDQLLFCLITDAEVFLIQTLPHNAEHLWVNTQLIQIIHDNWPEQIVRGRHTGLLPEDFSAEKRHFLRGFNANFLITVSDGTVYLPPAGGTMTSGESQDDRVNCDKIFAELSYWQNFVLQNAVDVRAALKLSPSKPLRIRMAFDNRVCCFYEPSLATRIAFNMPDDAEKSND
jgi:hypothetical protein